MSTRRTLINYFRRCFAPSQTPSEAKKYRNTVAKFSRFVGPDIPITQVDDAVVKKFGAWLAAQGFATATITSYLCHIRAIVRQGRPEAFPKLTWRRPAPPLDVKGGLLDFFESTYQAERMVGATAGAALQYNYAIRSFAKFLGSPPELTDLTDQQVSAYLGWLLKQGRTRDTANSKRQWLLALWRHAWNKGLLDQAPRVPKLKTYRRLPEAWTIEQLGQLLASCAGTPGMVGPVQAGDWWSALVLTLYDSGLRYGAAMAIERTHVDLSSARLCVPAENQKNKTEQRFRLSEQTVGVIRRIWEPPRRLLFPWEKSLREIHKAYGRIVDRAGLPNGPKHKFHCLRRTTASHIARAAGAAKAGEQLGHSGADVTKRYIDPTIAQTDLDATVYLPRPKF